MEILAIKNLPDSFDQLVTEAAGDGHAFLRKMKSEWESGKNRFDQEREILFAIKDPCGRLMGVGGLNIDPYLDDPSVGRIRHVYIARAHRGTGVGKLLLSKIIEHARGKFQTLRLRTQNPIALQFYYSMGFQLESNSDSSHFYLVLQLSPKEA